MMQQNSLSPKTDIKVFLGSSILLIYIIISTLVFGPLIILAIIFPFTVRYKLALLWVNCLLWVLKMTCGLTYEVEGLENIPDHQACIVLSKHQSAWETVALRVFLPPQTTVLKRSLIWIPVGGWALATLKPIAIDRENQRVALKTLVNQGISRLKEGLFVVIFPEGTRAAPGENKKFNAGGAILAQKSGYPVIPLAHNAGKFWPRYSFFKYPGVVKVKIGPPIKTAGKKAKAINAEAEAWIIQAMEAIEKS